MRKSTVGIAARRFTLACTLALSCVAVGVRAQLPGLGDDLGMNPGAERRLGDLIARDMHRDPSTIDDPVLQQYLEEVWQQLLGAARRRGEIGADIESRFAWRLFLVRDRSVNAFALPGGYMGVHLGLIAAVQTRDELAAVLAHETAHMSQRHIPRMVSRQNQQAPWILGAMILGALAVRSSPDLANAAIVGSQAAALQGQLNFSRDMEREADRIGLAVMGDAGFAMRGAVAMFERLQQAARLNDSGSYPYLRTHPMTTERIADAQARLELSGVSAPANLPDDVHAMMSARARVVADGTVDALRQRVAEARVLPEQASGPRAMATLYAATLAWIRLRDFEQARSSFQRLTKLWPSPQRLPAQVQWLNVELALAAGDAAQALRIAKEAGEGRAHVMWLAQASLAAGDAVAAAQQLQTWLAVHPRDASAWDLLARAQSQRGLQVAAVRAQAEASAARMDLAAARDRFKAAQDLARRGGVDHVEQSILDARTRQTDADLREQQRSEQEFK